MKRAMNKMITQINHFIVSSIEYHKELTIKMR
jgi:hypothetical protein